MDQKSFEFFMFDFTCPICRQQLKLRIGELIATPNVTCDSCKNSFNFRDDKDTDFRFNEMIEGLQEIKKY